MAVNQHRCNQSSRPGEPFSRLQRYRITGPRAIHVSSACIPRSRRGTAHREPACAVRLHAKQQILHVLRTLLLRLFHRNLCALCPTWCNQCHLSGYRQTSSPSPSPTRWRPSRAARIPKTSQKRAPSQSNFPLPANRRGTIYTVAMLPRSLYPLSNLLGADSAPKLPRFHDSCCHTIWLGSLKVPSRNITNALSAVYRPCTLMMVFLIGTMPRKSAFGVLSYPGQYTVISVSPFRHCRSSTCRRLVCKHLG